MKCKLHKEIHNVYKDIIDAMRSKHRDIGYNKSYQLCLCNSRRSNTERKS